MCTYQPVSEVVKLTIMWIRGDDNRLKDVFKSLKEDDGIRHPINLISFGKTYMLEDGGHRITAAYKLFEETGEDVMIRIRKHVADFL